MDLDIDRKNKYSDEVGLILVVGITMKVSSLTIRNFVLPN
jgi:hypothetical protein